MLEIRQAIAVQQALEKARPEGAVSWTLPEWDHQLTAGIFPFVVRTGDRAIPLGTAFCFSKLGLIASAYHVVSEALSYHPRCDQLRKERWLSEGDDLAPLSFDVLHRHNDRFTVWPLRTLQGAKPTDVIFAHPHVDGTFPYLALPLSFAVPRIGSRVLAVGYGGLMTGRHGLSISNLKSGDFTELKAAGLAMNVIEGRVTRVFTKRFATGYVEGPCFEIDCEVPPGMSGGPVFNDEGCVCGVVAAGAGIYSKHGGTIVSLLYPLVPIAVNLEVVLTSNFTIKSEVPLIELITRDSVTTDRSEEHLPLESTREGTIAGVRLHREDRGYIFDDLHGALEGRAAENISGPAFHYRRLDG